MLGRFVSNWVYGGALAAVLLLLLLPLLSRNWSTWMVATYLHLPIYMLHQLEEHDRDRFRIFFNRTIGEGFEALSSLAVFVTNVPGVWLVVTVALYAAIEVHPGWALVAAYLVLVNAFVHIAHAVIFKQYNPGLATAILLFIPLGGVTVWLLHSADAADMLHHAVGLASAVLIHAAILVHVRRRLQHLKRGLASSTQ